MKRYTSRVLAAAWGVGAAFMVVTLIVIRLRLDKVIELTV
jgi:hypothetical protein